jgi:hypothetical protein
VYQGREVRAQGITAWCGATRSVGRQRHLQYLGLSGPGVSEPLVLITNLPVSPEAVLCLYRERWPVEQVPQVAKPLLGLGRQWVFAPESIWRLPELALLAANILLYLAAVLPPMPTGFWDRQPQRSPGRLRRVLAQGGFPQDFPLDGRIREKHSVMAHLPKGIEAHRR